MRAAPSFYYVADHLGSVVGLFSATGTWIGGYSYSPYGEARFTSTSSVITNNALRYIGEHHDGAGIYKLGARYYDTAQGRFTQMDPSGQEANPYAYASCNPINSSDSSGLVACQGAINRTIASTVLVGVSLIALVASGAAAAPLVAGAIGATLTAYGIARTAYYAGDAVNQC
ncbi:RHS repeat-associated core domain-containing protein [Microbacterium sp. SSW1-59]|uniref:RHS repeat-associated core domain-containing protein n=1 Tax=Microbacterium xanthum TaxID=3079794 RepID=UPI002AD53F0E|nr:RHS repeat-associated core domain-containing protein [Microbacterium sp. SSW1-59]MDZ8200987.1 RHS repeat-associated core domain-containing protein [Microbacterium sp. SSW1-59]